MRLAVTRPGSGLMAESAFQTPCEGIDEAGNFILRGTRNAFGRHFARFDFWKNVFPGDAIVCEGIESR